MTNITNRFRILGGALLLSLCASGAQAAGYAGTQFEIEMVVFSRDDGMNQSRETWPAAPILKYGEHWVDFQTPSSEEPGTPVLVPVESQLTNKVAALQRDPGYTVLFHKTWRQVLETQRRAPQVMIKGGPTFSGHHALEGSVTLSVSRYLHVSTNLWLSEFLQQPLQQTMGIDGSGATGIALPPQPKTSLATEATEEEPMGLAANAGAGFTNADSTANGSYSTSADSAAFFPKESSSAPQKTYASRVAVLNEERRLRSGELHYIDHPQLGLLIQIRKVEESLEDAEDSEDSAEDLGLPANS